MRLFAIKDSALPAASLAAQLRQLTELPPGFSAHRLIGRLWKRRLEMADETFVTVVEYVYRVGAQAFRAGRIAYDYDESDNRDLHRRVHELGRELGGRIDRSHQGVEGCIEFVAAS